MIIRLSAKLSRKLHSKPLHVLPPDPDLLVDWSANLFRVERTEYILFTNTASRYSVVIRGRGITDVEAMLEQTLEMLGEVMRADGLEREFEQRVKASAVEVAISKALDKSVTGNMNDFIAHARRWLLPSGLTLFETSWKLNDILMGQYGYLPPRYVLTGMLQTLSATSPDSLRVD